MVFFTTSIAAGGYDDPERQPWSIQSLAVLAKSGWRRGKYCEYTTNGAGFIVSRVITRRTCGAVAGAVSGERAGHLVHPRPPLPGDRNPLCLQVGADGRVGRRTRDGYYGLMFADGPPNSIPQRSRIAIWQAR